MTAKTGAQRQSSLTARRKAAGLVRVEVWVSAEIADYVRELMIEAQRGHEENQLIKLSWQYHKKQNQRII